MPRYYTAKDMADHYSSKLDVKLTEEDIHRIMKNASPGIDKYNGLYPEEESNKFEKYFEQYNEKIQPVIEGADKALSEPSMSERIDNAKDRYEKIAHETDLLYKKATDNPDADIDALNKHYGKVKETLDSAKKDIISSEQLVDKLIHDDYSGNIDKFNKINSSLTYLDDAERKLEIAERIIDFDIGIENKEEIISSAEDGFEEKQDILEVIENEEEQPVNTRKDAITNVSAVGTGEEIDEPDVEDEVISDEKTKSKTKEVYDDYDKDEREYVRPSEQDTNEPKADEAESGFHKSRREKNNEEREQSRVDNPSDGWGEDERERENDGNENNGEKDSRNSSGNRNGSNSRNRNREDERDSGSESRDSGSRNTGETGNGEEQNSSGGPHFERHHDNNNSRMNPNKDIENKVVDKDKRVLDLGQNGELRNAVRSVRQTYMDLSGFNESEAAQGYNKIRPGVDVASSIARMNAGRIANQRALNELHNVDFNSIEKLMQKNGTLQAGQSLRMASEKDREEYLKKVSSYFKKEGLADPTRLNETELKKLLSSGRLTKEQKEIADSLLKVNKLGAGNRLINGGQRSLRGTGTRQLKRIAGDNDIMQGAFMASDVVRNARKAYRAFNKTMKYGGQAIGAVKTLVPKLTAYVAEDDPIGSASKAGRKNFKASQRPKNLREARKWAQTTYKAAQTAASAMGHSAMASSFAGVGGVITGSVTGLKSYSGVRLLGTGVKGAGKFVLGGPRTWVYGAKNVLTAPIKIIKGVKAGTLGGTLLTKAILVIVAAIFQMMMVMSCIGCCVAFMVAILSYSNDAFGTSNSTLQNILNFAETIGFNENSDNPNDSDEGVQSKVEDSVGWHALVNAGYFYSNYENNIEDGLKKKVKNIRIAVKNVDDEGNEHNYNGYDKTQDISKIFLEENPADAYLYNNISGNEDLKQYFGSNKGLKNINPITYYISSNTVDQVLDGAVGSEYPYWNATEILAMSSVRYQNSINPYNYRRYNRHLRYEAYSVDVGIVKKALNWFSDAFGIGSGKDNNIKINGNEIYISDRENNGYDPNYTGKEKIYIGFTKLTLDDMKKLTNNRHSTSYMSVQTQRDGGLDQADFDNWVEKQRNAWVNDYACNNYQEIYRSETKQVEDGWKPNNGGRKYKDVTYYYYDVYCQEHYLVQAYVRCATLKGDGNLYEIDDENGNNKGLLESLKDKIFPPAYNQWSEANGSDDNPANPDAVEAKEEVAEMITENWESTYGFKWSDAFEGDSWTLYAKQLAQGNGELKDEDGNLTPLGHAREYIEDKLDKIHNAKKGDFTDEEIRRIEIVDAATSYAGRLRYYYGADDVTNGISDCSAFISEAMGIERTTTASIMGWTHKDWSELQPGDLICKDGHVRMYVCTLGSGGNVRYLTVENTSGSSQTENVSGCSCALYSQSELEADGYVPIDISAFCDSNRENVD